MPNTLVTKCCLDHRNFVRENETKLCELSARMIVSCQEYGERFRSNRTIMSKIIYCEYLTIN